MDQETGQNEMKNGNVYVRFGTHESDEMPLGWAEKMLTELKQTNGTMFGRLLTQAIGIEPKKR